MTSGNALRRSSLAALFICLSGCGAAADTSSARGSGSGRGPVVPNTPRGAAAVSGGIFAGSSGGLSQPGLAGNTSTFNPIAAAPINPGAVCASAVVRTAKTMPTIVFVIDGSGSMCAPFGNGSTRWQSLRSALLDPQRGLVYRLQNAVSFGLAIYDGTIDLALALTGALGAAPAPMGGMGPNLGQNPPCALAYAEMKAMGMCPQLLTVLPAARNNAPALDMAFPQTELGGSTPTDRALSTVMDQLIAGVQVQGPDTRAVSPVYVILATDGAPNDICVGGVGGDGAPQRQGVIAAVDRGAMAGITTWVISLAGGDAALQAHLDEVARHGDPKNTMAHTFVPTNPDDLVMTLARLLGGAVGCNIDLSGRVAVGQECMGNVTLGTNKLACCQQAMPNASWACDGKPIQPPNGWRLQSDHSIELVGDACARFLIGADDSLEATFPCEVFTPL